MKGAAFRSGDARGFVQLLSEDEARGFVQLLSEDEVGLIKEICQKSPAGNEPSKPKDEKFCCRQLKMADPAAAAYGLEYLMGVMADTGKMRKYRSRISKEVKGIKKEVNEFAINDSNEDPDRQEVKSLLNYILNEKVSEKVYENGIRDKGRKEERLSDFINNTKFKKAKLSEAELVAMRLYTTKAYKFINTPLRKDQEQSQQCLLPVTTYFASSGIKKLRALNASSPQLGRTLWRGMRNVKVQDDFLRNGGTESAFMSTSSDLSVAVRYCLSENSVLFKIVSQDFMSTGADVQWFSAFPQEAEVLYPPLTYLRPTGRSQTVEVTANGQLCLFTVVEMHPVMS